MYKRHIVLVLIIFLFISYLSIKEKYKPEIVIPKQDNSIVALDLKSVPRTPILDCDTFLKYKNILASYFPMGYEIDLDTELKYKGSSIAGSSQYNDIEYRCCLIYYNTRNSGEGRRKMLIPVVNMSDYWFNELLWNEVHENISYILTGIDDNIVKVDTQAYRDNINILGNDYNINLKH